MKLVEFRLAMPLTLEEYKLCQLYLVAKASLEDSEKNLNSVEKNENESKKGIVILKNESYKNENGLSGQYTYKRINLLNKLPKWLLNFIDPKYCILDEKSWNSYPYLKTVYESSGFPKAKIQVESAHHMGFNTENNALNISEELLPLRKIIFIDIVNDKVSYKDYNPKEDPSIFYSEKAKRGKLDEKWKENSTPIMTCYKLFTINIPYFGIFCSRIENWIISSLKDNILKYHRKAFCWIDEWFDLTIEDIRNIEKDVQKKLNHFWNESEQNNIDKTNDNDDEKESLKRQECFTTTNYDNKKKIIECDNIDIINNNNFDNLNNNESTIDTCEKKKKKSDSFFTNTNINCNKNETEHPYLSESLNKDAYMNLHNYSCNANSFVNDKNILLQKDTKNESHTRNEKELIIQHSHSVNIDNNNNMETLTKNISENKREKKEKKKKKDDYENENLNKPKKNESRRFSYNEKKSSNENNESKSSFINSRKVSLRVNTLKENNLNQNQVVEKVNIKKKNERKQHKNESDNFFFFKKNNDSNEYGEYLYRLNDGMFYSWKLRYFVMKNNKLCYYLNDKKSELKGEIDLLNAQIQWIGEYKGRNSVFVINSYSKNVVYLSSDDEIQTKKCMIDVQMATLLNNENVKNEVEEEKTSKKKLSNAKNHYLPIKQSNNNESEHTESKDKRNEKNDFINKNISYSNNVNDKNVINENICDEKINDEILYNINNYLNDEDNKNKSENKDINNDKNLKYNSLDNENFNGRNVIHKEDGGYSNLKKNDMIFKENEYIFSEKIRKNEIKGSFNVNSNYNFSKDENINNNIYEELNLCKKNNSYIFDKSYNFHDDDDEKKKNIKFSNEEKVNVKCNILNDIKNKTSYFSNCKNIEKIKLKSNIIPDDIKHFFINLNIDINEINLNGLQELTYHIKNFSIYKMNNRNKNIDLFYFIIIIFSVFSYIYSFITLYIYFKTIFYFLFFFLFCVFIFSYNENLSFNYFNNIYRCSLNVPVNINYLMKYLTSDNKYHLGEFNKKLFKTKKANLYYVFSSINIYFDNFFLSMFSDFFKSRSVFCSQYCCKYTSNNINNKKNENKSSYIFIQYTNEDAKNFFRLLNFNEEMYNSNFSWNNRTADCLNEKNNISKMKTNKNIKNKITNINDVNNLNYEELRINKNYTESFHVNNNSDDNKNNSINKINNEINNVNYMMKKKSVTIDEINNVNYMMKKKSVNIDDINNENTFNFYNDKKNTNTLYIKIRNIFLRILLKSKFLFKYFKRKYDKSIDMEGFDIFLIKEKDENLCEINYFTYYNYKSCIFNNLLNFYRCLNINSLLSYDNWKILNIENLSGDNECEEIYNDKIEKDSSPYIEKRKIEKEICRKILFNLNNEDNCKNVIQYIYDLSYNGFLNSKYISLIKNVDDVFFIINLSKTFLYIIEYIRLYEFKQMSIMNEYINNSKNNLDFSDNLFISNVILLLKSLNLLYYTFSNSFILSKKNEKFECSYDNSNVSIKMKNSTPLSFFLIAENFKSKTKITSDLNLATLCNFDEIKLIIENEIYIKNNNYQICLRYPNIYLKNIMHGHLRFSFSDKLVIKDSLNNCADIMFIDKSNYNGQFFGVIKRRETVTDILRGNIFDKIILNEDKEFSGIEGIQINMIHKKNIKNSTTLSLDYQKLSHIIEEKCKIKQNKY
ncbi:phosphatidylinositol transfer protein, putative [Plasmodium gallinaceum]|uniref:Phosphatidylinositol transfer protein, putative n=1 Tax=Plasmodium gallinaceum TaxID=5849 RepID=A0A1J1GV92_PLAGA|nr:phosphatidylinositol transfer protein, putative [Plasmodium gallinaceum]CRG95217.1 phosphatidylinositol transfer protein, putative [Plasmodium gallinaceum]